MFEISVSKLLLIGVIIALLFGTKKLRTFGSDLGESIKGFKKALQDDAPAASESDQPKPQDVASEQQKTTAQNSKKTDLRDE